MEKLSEILDIEYIETFVKIVNIKCKQIRIHQYSIEYYLYHIILVLTDKNGNL